MSFGKDTAHLFECSKTPFRGSVTQQLVQQRKHSRRFNASALSVALPREFFDCAIAKELGSSSDNDSCTFCILLFIRAGRDDRPKTQIAGMVVVHLLSSLSRQLFHASISVSIIASFFSFFARLLASGFGLPNWIVREASLQVQTSRAKLRMSPGFGVSLVRKAT